jgi:hypothetical protein
LSAEADVGEHDERNGTPAATSRVRQDCALKVDLDASVLASVGAKIIEQARYRRKAQG